MQKMTAGLDEHTRNQFLQQHLFPIQKPLTQGDKLAELRKQVALQFSGPSAAVIPKNISNANHPALSLIAEQQNLHLGGGGLSDFFNSTG
ncbi:hypothetical protein, partial [Pseudomonas aeruginosa]|uniref:hypothetical protein n=1 Tax=Pseudomonas aeruginosa TaxID=287 RepID=UPI0013CE0E63